MRAAVIGHPIAHSKSPALHEAAYRCLGRSIDYRAIDVPPEDLPSFFTELRRAPQEWAGVSVTMPHKAAAVELIDHPDELVTELGVLNTVLVDESGALHGKNTDVIGIVRALAHAQQQAGREECEDEDVGADAMILGGGGTASAALAALHERGARRVQLALRRPEQAAPLQVLSRRWGMELRVSPLAETDLSSAPLVISTLPPHAADALGPGSPGAEGAHQSQLSGALLLDVAYAPWPSDLARRWQAHGGRAVSGLEMLLYQAVAQVAAFTGEDLTDRPDVINVMCDSVGLLRR